MKKKIINTFAISLFQRVYPSPSKRQMDSKGTHEEIAYPNIYFTVDNFDDVS